MSEVVAPAFDSRSLNDVDMQSLQSPVMDPGLPQLIDSGAGGEAAALQAAPIVVSLSKGSYVNESLNVVVSFNIDDVNSSTATSMFELPSQATGLDISS